MWKRIERDVRELGDDAVFVTVRWSALDAEGEVLDTRTTPPSRRPTAGASCRTRVTSNGHARLLTGIDHA